MKMALLVKTHSGTTIVHVLQDTCQNCSHFGLSYYLTIICTSRCQCFRLMKICVLLSLTLSLGNRKKSLGIIKSGECE